MFIKIIKIILLVILTSPVATFAMALSGDNQIIATIDPSKPEPFTKVTVSLNSYSYDLDQSEIEWSVDGVKQITQIGAKKFSFETGVAGKRQSVLATITGNDGTYTEKTISINPANIDMVWQSEGYVPPFYKGKVIASVGSVIKIYAMPNFFDDNGHQIPNNQLLYEWRKDHENFIQGYGKNYIAIKMPNSYIATNIAVTVSQTNGDIISSRAIEITPHTAKMILYENKPLIGVDYDTTITNNAWLNNNEIVINAEPYFLPVTTGLSGINFTWTMNDTLFTGGVSGNKAILRQESGQNGIVKISAVGTNGNQSATGDVSINIGNNRFNSQ